MISFVCCYWQPGLTDLPGFTKCYDPSWVSKLFRGIRRNYKGEDWEFVCLDHFVEPETGWSPMMQVWDPKRTKGDIIIPLGLDMVFTGDITEICNTDCEVGLIRDPYRKYTICNGLGIYTRECANLLWDIWENNKEECIKECTTGRKYFSEMAFLRKYVGLDCTLLDELYPNQILSYKVHCKQNPPPPSARIVYFHGTPKQHQIEQEWIKEVWK